MGQGRGSNRSYGIDHRQKAKTKKEKQRSGGGYAWERKYAATAEEIIGKTFGRLNNLGTQLFASTPYSEHYGRWLSNLEGVLAEFESSLTPDEEYVKETTQIVTTVRHSLEQRRAKEARLSQSSLDISNSRTRLEDIERTFREDIQGLERHTITQKKSIESRITELKKQLDETEKLRTGFLRGISKEEKERRLEETNQKIENARGNLSEVEKQYAMQMERLRAQYETERRPLVDKILKYDQEVNVLEKDVSLEARRAASEALSRAVQKFLERRRNKIAGQSASEFVQGSDEESRK